MIVLYLLAVVIANLTVAVWGPAASVFNAFLLIGFDLVARDRLHDRWSDAGLWWRMGALIAAGSLLSLALALLLPGALPAAMVARVGLASCLAFAGSGVADALAYHALRRRPWLVRANGSNLAGAAVDSVLFPSLAFGAVLPLVILGQFAAKVAGGVLWSAMLARVTARRAAGV